MIDFGRGDVLRAYTPNEVAADGYPPEWHRGCVVIEHDQLWALAPDVRDHPEQRSIGIKHHVRALAGYRCVRCGHPWAPDAADRGPHQPEWTPCDRKCEHIGPLRAVHPAHRAGVAEPPPGMLAWQAVRGAANGWVIEASWRVLTVHHLDGVKANCRWWNLAALCQRCHLEIQGKVQMSRVWPWEHSEWFKPYVAGYYAHTYLQEDVTREQAVARIDELLSLERIA